MRVRFPPLLPIRASGEIEVDTLDSRSGALVGPWPVRVGSNPSSPTKVKNMKIIKNTVKEIKAYLYMRKKTHIKILEYKLKEVFGYHPATSITSTRLRKYMFYVPRSKGLPMQWQIMDRIYVPIDYESYKPMAIQAPGLAVNDIDYCLMDKKWFPWWLLGEFGGPLKDIPDDFLKYLEAANV